MRAEVENNRSKADFDNIRGRISNVDEHKIVGEASFPHYSTVCENVFESDARGMRSNELLPSFSPQPLGRSPQRESKQSDEQSEKRGECLPIVYDRVSGANGVLPRQSHKRERDFLRIFFGFGGGLIGFYFLVKTILKTFRRPEDE